MHLILMRTLRKSETEPKEKASMKKEVRRGFFPPSETDRAGGDGILVQSYSVFLHGTNERGLGCRVQDPLKDKSEMLPHSCCLCPPAATTSGHRHWISLGSLQEPTSGHSSHRRSPVVCREYR